MLLAKVSTSTYMLAFHVYPKTIPANFPISTPPSNNTKQNCHQILTPLLPATSLYFIAKLLDRVLFSYQPE
jgi:hypothetical protein